MSDHGEVTSRCDTDVCTCKKMRILHIYSKASMNRIQIDISTFVEKFINSINHLSTSDNWDFLKLLQTMSEHVPFMTIFESGICHG